MSVAESPRTQGQVSHVIVASLFAESALKDVYLASMTILAYDYVLMLRHEIQFVWRSADWRLGKCLYLATRYLGFVSNILAITGNFHHGLSVHACAVIETSADWTLLAEIGIAQVILYIRTYAIWGQSRSIKYLLISIFLRSYSSRGALDTNSLLYSTSRRR